MGRLDFYKHEVHVLLDHSSSSTSCQTGFYSSSTRAFITWEQGSAQVFSAGMKIVVDKNLENTVWQCFWRLFNKVLWTTYQYMHYLRHLESHYCILRWIKCIWGHLKTEVFSWVPGAAGRWQARPPCVGRTLWEDYPKLGLKNISNLHQWGNGRTKQCRGTDQCSPQLLSCEGWIYPIFLKINFRIVL
jgi:hypothetical protein